MRWILGAFGLFFYSSAMAAGFSVQSSTPDNALTGSATADYPLGGPVQYIYLKNDCSDDIYFALRGGTVVNDHTLRLAQDQAFESDALTVRTLGASPSSGAGACTFTLVIGR